jgi:hypothetical protein
VLGRRARGKVGSIGVVVGIEMVVDKTMDVVDDEELESEIEVEIEVGSYEIERERTLGWTCWKRRSIEVEVDHSEEGRPIRST